jgi:hypothetical protein
MSARDITMRYTMRRFLERRAEQEAAQMQSFLRTILPFSYTEEPEATRFDA